MAEPESLPSKLRSVTEELDRTIAAAPVPTLYDGVLRLARAYLERNPPWRQRAVLWACELCCLAADEKERTERPHPAARDDQTAECDLCGARAAERSLRGLAVRL